MATKTLIDGKNNHQTKKPTSASMGLSDFQSHVLREFTSLSEKRPLGQFSISDPRLKPQKVSEKTDYPNRENRGF